MTVLDLLLPIIIVIGLLLGYKKGFFETVSKPLKLVFTICLTIIIAAPVIKVWTRPLFTDKVHGWIYSSLMERCPDITAETASDSLPTILKLTAEIFKIDISTSAELSSAEAIIDAVSEKMAVPLGNLIAVVVTYAVLFFVSLIFTKIMLAILNKCVKKGFLGHVNQILGLITGGMIATIVASIISSVAFKVSAEFASGQISTFIRNINPFAILMKF